MNINILDFGAKPDGLIINTQAIQNAIDKCSENGGGRVVVPSGVFKTGTIWLKSNVELHLEIGAELVASDNLNDYNNVDAYEQNSSCVREGWVGKHLIIAHEIDNVAITGFGKINGNCQAFVTRVDSPSDRFWCWCHGYSVVKDSENLRPGQLVCFIECKNVRVHDITIENSPCWSCYLLGSENVDINGLKVNNPIWMLNSDGIDIDASRNVTVSNCIINTGDDAITLRACEQKLKNKNMTCEDVVITNCVLSTGICAFRIGVGIGTIKRARISNITVKMAQNLVQFCTAYLNIGKANIKDVNFSNISATNTDRLIEAFANNETYIKDISMQNIKTTSTMANYLDAINGVIDNINFKDIEIEYFDRATNLSENNLKVRGNTLFSINKASNITFNNVKIKGGFYDNPKKTKLTKCKNVKKINCNF